MKPHSARKPSIRINLVLKPRLKKSGRGKAILDRYVKPAILGGVMVASFQEGRLHAGKSAFEQMHEQVRKETQSIQKALEEMEPWTNQFKRLAPDQRKLVLSRIRQLTNRATSVVQLEKDIAELRELIRRNRKPTNRAKNALVGAAAGIALGALIKKLKYLEGKFGE